MASPLHGDVRMSKSVASLILVLGAATACTSSHPDTVQITITAHDGSQQHELSGDELTATLHDPLRVFRADGASSQNPLRILEAGSLELPLPGDAGTFVATRTGTTLAGNDLSVSWSDDLTQLVVHTPDSDLDVSITGLSDPRDR